MVVKVLFMVLPYEWKGLCLGWFGLFFGYWLLGFSFGELLLVPLLLLRLSGFSYTNYAWGASQKHVRCAPKSCDWRRSWLICSLIAWEISLRISSILLNCCCLISFQTRPKGTLNADLKTSIPYRIQRFSMPLGSRSSPKMSISRGATWTRLQRLLRGVFGQKPLVDVGHLLLEPQDHEKSAPKRNRFHYFGPKTLSTSPFPSRFFTSNTYRSAIAYNISSCMGDERHSRIDKRKQYYSIYI